MDICIIHARKKVARPLMANRHGSTPRSDTARKGKSRPRRRDGVAPGHKTHPNVKGRSIMAGHAPSAFTLPSGNRYSELLAPSRSRAPRDVAPVSGAPRDPAQDEAPVAAAAAAVEGKSRRHPIRTVEAAAIDLIVEVLSRLHVAGWSPKCTIE
mmetsp:Transcript_61866/g.182677  ORF Transcript_61866/g.182677 Transcript_61866/m.182677 type:complete len:154 (+) Transcript_61866:3731-4192(+)